MSTYFAQFNNFYLKSDDYHITKIDIGAPKPINNKYELARADGLITTNQNYGERTITVTGSIKAKDLDGMNTKLDTLKANLVGYDKNLDVYLGTLKRRFRATVDSFNYETQGYYCEYEIKFSANSFATDLDNNALVFGTYTANNTSYTNNIEGSFKSKAYMQLQFAHVAPYWVTTYLQINNAAKNQRIRFTNTWGWYDRIILDGTTKSATIYPTTITVIDNCDSITGWTSGSTLASETGTKLQGTAGFKTTTNLSTNSNNARLNATAIDLSSTLGTVIIPIYITTPTSGSVDTVRLEIGSDANITTNFLYWDKTTQWNGTAISYNSWNYIAFDLSTAATSTTGTPVRTAIKSIRVSVRQASNFQCVWYMDYITIQKASITPTALDYEGQFPDLNLGNCTFTLTDEYNSRSIAITGSYYKRYI